MPFKIYGNEKYQLFFLKKAINEIINNYYNDEEEKKITNKLSIREDHINGCNFINGKKLPIIFPLYINNFISSLDKNKSIDYNFIGIITPKRKWILKYKEENSIIKTSNYGRDQVKKYNIDSEYYNILSKSKFTLTPTGDCPWSYRFFEAIMCFSIPILENNTNDIYAKDYFFYFDDDEHIYDEKKAQENYEKFINSDHFLKKEILSCN